MSEAMTAEERVATLDDSCKHGTVLRNDVESRDLRQSECDECMEDHFRAAEDAAAERMRERCLALAYKHNAMLLADDLRHLLLREELQL